MLDVSDAVRAEIGDEEAGRLLAGQNSPGRYDCTSCRAPGDSWQERTSTVLFVGEETAVLAFAHAVCVPSQVVNVPEEQLQGAVATLAGGQAAAVSAPADALPDRVAAAAAHAGNRQAVLGVTCGQVLIDDTLHPAVVVEPAGPIARPGSPGSGDDFLPLLIEHGFQPVADLDTAPAGLSGWSVLLAMGRLHGILQPSPDGGSQPTSWWQAHEPLPVTEGWRTTANKTHTVLVYASPAGTIGEQPREDLMREALEKSAARGTLVAAAMPLAGT